MLLLGNKRIRMKMKRTQTDWSGEIMDTVLTVSIFLIIIFLTCLEGQIKWSTVLIVGGCIVGIVGIVLLILMMPNVISAMQKRRFNKRFDWLLRHKDELPLSDEEKEMFCEENKKYIGIDDEFYKEMRRYVKNKNQ